MINVQHQINELSKAKQTGDEQRCNIQADNTQVNDTPPPTKTASATRTKMATNDFQLDDDPDKSKLSSEDKSGKDDEDESDHEQNANNYKPKGSDDNVANNNNNKDPDNDDNVTDDNANTREDDDNIESDNNNTALTQEEPPTTTAPTFLLSIPQMLDKFRSIFDNGKQDNKFFDFFVTDDDEVLNSFQDLYGLVSWVTVMADEEPTCKVTIPTFDLEQYGPSNTKMLTNAYKVLSLFIQHHYTYAKQYVSKTNNDFTNDKCHQKQVSLGFIK